MKALIVGWFSFEEPGTTAGDLLACDLLCEWLEAEGYQCDRAHSTAFPGGVDFHEVDPDDYAFVVFVCGPFIQNVFEAELLGRFARSYVVGVNVTLPVPLDTWSPFDLLFERDSSATARPDMTFASRQGLVPVVGVCKVEPYDGARVADADRAIDDFVATREAALVPIDTRLAPNETGLRTKAEVESLLARMDLVITTRLHGTVLSLKNGVPVIAIDPEAGGAKVKRQAETIGWPAVFTVDALDERALGDAFEWCLTPEARAKAREVSDRAARMVEEMRGHLVAALRSARAPGPGHAARTAFAEGFGRDREP